METKCFPVQGVVELYYGRNPSLHCALFCFVIKFSFPIKKNTVETHYVLLAKGVLG